MLDIGITLRKYRDKYNHTQQYVANLIGISRVTYRKWENNEVDFTITQLSRIAELYNLQVHEIIRSSYLIRVKVAKQPISSKDLLEKEFIEI